MNVRFFGGLKSEYSEISKHTPVGLFLCADTRELFWGDWLLSDGIRIVPTYADLPSIEGHKAAEGIIYFVEETKNGYVLPQGGSEWIQIIYAPTGTQGVDLSDYYTKVEVDEALLAAIAKVEISKDLVTEAELASRGYATKDDLTKAIDAIEHPTLDLEGYAKLEDLPNISNLTTKEELADAITGIEHPTIDLTDYSTKDYVKTIANTNKYEVLPIDGMLITYRGDEVRLNTERVIPTQQNVGATGNPNQFYVTFRAYAPEGATQVLEGIINGTTGEVTKDTEFSTLSTDIYGRKYTTIWAAIAQYTGTSWLNYGSMSTVDKYLGHRYVFDWYNEDKIIGSDRFNVILTNDTCHNDPIPEAVAKHIKKAVDAVQVPSLEGFATEDYVDEAIAKIDFPGANLSNYYTKTETQHAINAAIADIKIPENYVTETELQEALNNIKHPTVSLEGYATETWVSDQNFATKKDLSEALEGIEAPVVDLSEYALKSEVALKADAVLFTTDHFITNALGGFSNGENVKGLTITQLFAKLLGLSTVENPDNPNPELPDDPQGLIDNIIANKTSMYAVNTNGELAEVPYKYILLSEETATAAPMESGFYQIKDSEGNIKESGYQELQIKSEDTYYVIALPKGIDYSTMVTTQAYSDALGKWFIADNFAFTSDPIEVASICDDAGIDISTINTDLYTIWAVEECPTGSKLRFIITEIKE